MYTVDRYMNEIYRDDRYTFRLEVISDHIELQENEANREMKEKINIERRQSLFESKCTLFDYLQSSSSLNAARLVDPSALEHARV